MWFWLCNKRTNDEQNIKNPKRTCVKSKINIKSEANLQDTHFSAEGKETEQKETGSI